MRERFPRKLVSLILSMLLVIQMIPSQALALSMPAEAGEKTAQAAADPRLEQGEVAPSSQELAASAETANIVCEIPEGRGAFQKEFQMDNGLRQIVVYPMAVHYEDDGQWKEIDNTWQPVSATGTVLTAQAAAGSAPAAYRNTSGMWDVELPSALSTNQSVKVSKDGYTLQFRFAGELSSISAAEALPRGIGEISVSGQALSSIAVQTAQANILEQESIPYEIGEQAVRMPEENASALTYANVYRSTDVRYDLQSNQLKESVIIRELPSGLRGYRYVLDAPGMSLELQQDKSIHAYAENASEGEDPVFYLPAPYLMDQNRQFCGDVEVTLEKTGTESYTLTYLLPQEWMADAERAYPVVLDPIVQPVSNTYTIRDVSLFEQGQFSYLWGLLETGYDPDCGRERILIKFSDLPTLSAADVIVQAYVSLSKYDARASSVIQAHKVNGTWDSATATWANQPSHDPTVEDYQIVSSPGWYSWDITNIAQKWYAEDLNTGLMFRTPDSVENGGTLKFDLFYSSDWGANQAPVLQIFYLNNSGLEEYWDYTTHTAGRAGTGHISNFTGNLIWVHNRLGFSGNRMPVAIDHVYNTNDQTSNDCSTGYGWRTNYHQKVYSWSSGGTSYYVWIDQDGTRRYFPYDAQKGKYVNEIDSTLTLTASGSGTTKYCIEDKNGNRSYFDSSGRLSKIENNQATKSSITITYADSTSQRISTITDGAGRKYQFTYSGGLVSKIAFLGTGTTEITALTYSYDTSGNLTGIAYPDGESVAFGYSGSHGLTSVTDVSGYKLTYTYNTTNTAVPNRVIRVNESQGSDTGGALNIEYAHNQTTFTDHNGQQEILQFNNYGNTVSIQNSQGQAQFYQYAKEDTGMSAIRAASQLTLASKLQNTVVNMLRNGGFEWKGFWEADSGNATTGSWGYKEDTSGSSPMTYAEWFSLYITRTENGTPYLVHSTADSVCSLEPGHTYTLSGYVKTTGMSGQGTGAGLGIRLSNGTELVAQSETICTNSDWTRLEVTYTHPATSAATTATVCLLNGSVGTAYFDCIQYEESPSASRYNLIENGDLRYGAGLGSPLMGWRFGDECTSTEGRVSVSDSGADVLDTNALRFVGSPTACKRGYQNLLIAGSAGDVYSLSAWAKGDAVPVPEDSNRRFGILFRFYNADGTETEKLMSFNPDCDSQGSWQFGAMRVVADKAYTSIRILPVYEYNANTVYFDGIQVFREEFGHSYVYDDDGNVVSSTDLQGQNTTYEYTNNQLTKMTLPSGASQTYTYDSYHNVLTATSPEGVVSGFTYDTYGNNTKVTVGSGDQKITSTAAYSSNGNLLTSVTDALGQTTTYGYDSQTGILNWVQAPGQTTTDRTTYTYDSLYRTTGTAQSDSQVNYEYADDLLDAITSPSGTEYGFTYGAFNLVQQVKVGSRALITHQYSQDANRYLTKSTYGNEDFISYTYDALGRLASQSYEDGDTVSYVYDGNGNLGLMNDGLSGRTTKYLYDLQDRLMRYEESGSGYSNTVEWGYDDDNNLSSQTQILNGTEYTTSYTYDDDNRLTGSTQGDISSAYAYDGFSRMTSITGKSGSAAVITSNIGYKAPSDTAATAQIQTWSNVTAQGTTTYTYTYDSRGNITSVSDGTHTTSYVYDSKDQLLRENNQAAGKTWVYTYDDGGNILSKAEYAYSTGELGTALDTIAYGYGDTEWKDLLTSYDGQALSTDAIGNRAGDGEWTYNWKHGRQLVSMLNGLYAYDFEYDASGRRTAKTIRYERFEYHYAGDQLTALTWGNQTMSFTYDTLGPATLTYDGATYYYLRNAQGDIVGITNAQGVQVVAYTYDAWGKPLSTTGTMAGTPVGWVNPFRYRGYVYDDETGFYYLQSRYYDPEIGRFISADALLSQSDTFGNNMFAYCLNNPVNMADSSGKLPFSIIAAVAGAAAGAVVGGTAAAARVKSVAGGIGTGAVSSIKSAQSEENVFPIINHVTKTHTTTPTLMLDLGLLFGKVGFSITRTEDLSETPGLFHSYVDAGNDVSKYGLGVNAAGLIEASIGVSSSINIYVFAEVAPGLHGEVSVGLDGIGLMTGTTSDEQSSDLHVKAGWGLVFVIVGTFMGMTPAAVPG